DRRAADRRHPSPPAGPAAGAAHPRGRTLRHCRSPRRPPPMSLLIPRRAVLAAAGGALLARPALVRAQSSSEPIRIGSLTPNTGGGGQFGPEIAEAHRKVV